MGRFISTRLIVAGTFATSAAFWMPAREAAAQEPPVQFVLAWGTHGSSAGSFDQPLGVAADAAGGLYVVDKNNHRVQKFDPDGSFLLQWGSRGAAAGQFERTQALAISRNGKVYVLDYGNDRVQRFDLQGRHERTWGSTCRLRDSTGCVDPDGPGPRQWGDGQFDRPTGIAVDAQGDVFVADYGNARIQHFDADGGYVGQWGSRGFDPGSFGSLAGVAVDAGGHVYTLEEFPERVQVFTPDGTLVAFWGTCCKGPGEFERPQGFAVHEGIVYVADSSNHRIQAYTTTGSFLFQWGSACLLETGFGCVGNGAGQFWAPTSVAVDGSGAVYVTDRDNHRVQKFALLVGAANRPWGLVKSLYR